MRTMTDDTSSSALVKQMVVDKRGGASTFKRPDAEALSEWLAEYSLGDLWKKNLLGGRPGR